MSVRTYYGVNVYPITGQNAAGLRWEAHVDGRWVRADTLAGIKELIREALGH